MRSLMGTLALRQKMRIGEQPIGRGNMVKCDGQRITFSPGFGVLSPFVLMSIVTMSCGACCAPEYHTGPAFISRRYYLQHQRHDKTGARRMRVKSSLESSAGSNDGNAKDSDIAVNEESWCLGDGGFANRHLGDEERIIAKKVCPRFAIWATMAHLKLYDAHHGDCVGKSNLGAHVLRGVVLKC